MEIKDYFSDEILLRCDTQHAHTRIKKFFERKISKKGTLKKNSSNEI